MYRWTSGMEVFSAETHKTPYSHLGVEDTASTDYAALPFIFTRDTVLETDVLVDIGCGKGRVINWWLESRVRQPDRRLELDETSR